MYTGRKKVTKKQIIYYIIWAHGPVTCEEVEQLTGFKHQTASARITELMDARRVGINSYRNTSSGYAAAAYVVNQ